MIFTKEEKCNCGGRFVFSAYGDAEFESANCSECGMPGSLMDGLSVSVTAERLLHRSEQELDGGDYTLSILMGVMAIESYLTRLFLKLEGMANYATKFELPTAKQEAEWEEEYPRGGGFPGPVGFVSQRLVGTTFDEFVATSKRASAIFSALPDSREASPTKYFQNQLFRRRNRIAHWGYVNTSKSEAQLCHAVAIAAASILREMDAATDWVAFAERMAAAARSGVAVERQQLQDILAVRQRSERLRQAR